MSRGHLFEVCLFRERLDALDYLICPSFMDIKPLLGLCGVLIAAMTSEFNDQVTSDRAERRPEVADVAVCG